MNAPATLTEVSKEPTKERKIYTGLAARILNLIVSGCSQVQAASALGTTESYVSQLCLEQDFQIQVAERVQQDFEKAAQIDQNYLEMEKQLSDKLKTLIPFMHSPDQILKTIRYVNEAKKKTNPGLGADSPNGNGSTHAGITKVGVTLIIPQIVSKQFIVNPNNEVVQVDGRDLVTLNSESLKTLIDQRNLQKLPESVPQQSPPKSVKKLTLTNEDLSNL